jgi:hypothetical protein
MDVLPRDIALIVYRYIFDSRYDVVKEEYFRATECRPACMLYNGIIINYRDLSPTSSSPRLSYIYSVMDPFSTRNVNYNVGILPSLPKRYRYSLGDGRVA